MERPHQDFVKTLSDDELLLISLREELYLGSWDRMVKDLRDRLLGKPYIFKLVNRIEEDIQRIEKLRSYEQDHGIDLQNFVDPEQLES